MPWLGGATDPELLEGVGQPAVASILKAERLVPRGLAERIREVEYS